MKSVHAMAQKALWLGGICVFLSLVAQPVRAVGGSELSDQLARLIAGMDATSGLTAEQSGAISTYLEGRSDVQNAFNLTSANLAAAAHDAFMSVQLSPEETANAVAQHFDSLVVDRKKDDFFAIIQLLTPYAVKDGLCEAVGDAHTICAISFTSSGATADGLWLADDQDTAPGTKFQQAPAESDLGQILARVRDLIAIKMSSGGGSGTGHISTDYNGIPIDFDYAFGYVYDYSCNTSCDGVAEGYGSIKSNYLAGGADSVMAVVGAAIHCDSGCFLEGLARVITSYAGGQKLNLVKYLLDRGSKRNTRLRLGDAQARHAIAPSCGVEAVPYLSRPTYQYISEEEYKLPYDDAVVFRLGTHFQVPHAEWPASGVAEETPLFSTNLYPTPTHGGLRQEQNIFPMLGTGAPPSTVPSVLETWTYRFYYTQAWSFNIMFGGVQTADIVGACNTILTIPSTTTVSAIGNQFWYWRGPSAGYSPGLPSVYWLVGFKGSLPVQPPGGGPIDPTQLIPDPDDLPDPGPTIAAIEDIVRDQLDALPTDIVDDLVFEAQESVQDVDDLTAETTGQVQEEVDSWANYDWESYLGGWTDFVGQTISEAVAPVQEEIESWTGYDWEAYVNDWVDLAEETVGGLQATIQEELESWTENDWIGYVESWLEAVPSSPSSMSSTVAKPVAQNSEAVIGLK